ncbi:hypothetical protein Q5H91_09005 [Sphingomonas sp. KR1UV-12]|uniref:DUF1700 domain-containing protein n=1 Tax=Sphingomonas aurea TaxID=3063994 RepID=A0ABT9EKG5_9SPHN|nr:hypothetical protein [Sphingomonas sp. KR1UV-12]MDP1027350.1 hypothetical protein [Sphingomonas sp. KR1UV-12]
MTDEHRINDYVRRLGWSLQRLDPAERTALVDEIRSHLIESAAAGTDALDRALAGLDTPYALGRRFVEEYELAGAVSGSGPRRLLVALLGRSTRRVAGASAVFVAILCYLCALIFAAMAAIKPFAPGRVGAWRVGSGWEAGILIPTSNAPELLGLWIIPLSIALAIASYLAGTLVLRHTARLMLR